MASVHFWTEAPESFIASTYCRVEAIKLSGHVILYTIKKFNPNFINILIYYYLFFYLLALSFEYKERTLLDICILPLL